MMRFHWNPFRQMTCRENHDIHIHPHIIYPVSVTYRGWREALLLYLIIHSIDRHLDRAEQYSKVEVGQGLTLFSLCE